MFMLESKSTPYHILMHSIDSNGNDVIVYPITKADLVWLDSGINIYEALNGKVDGTLFTESMETLEGNINAFSTEISSFRTEMQIMKDSIKASVSTDTFKHFEKFIDDKLSEIEEFRRTTESWIEVATNQIEAKVSVSEYNLRKTFVDGVLDSLRERVTETESSLNIYQNEIALLVKKEEYENYKKFIDNEFRIISESYSNQQSSINMLNDAILLKVDTEEYERRNTYIDGEMGRIEENISTANSSIEMLDRAISLKVSTETFNKVIQNIQGDIGQVSNDLSYKVEIYSTDGSIFKNGNIETELIARIFKGSRNITDEIPASRIVWTRKSKDAASDLIWNEKYKNGAKSIRITSDDVHLKAVFNCHLLRND